jgi:hypothetical protein
MMSNFDDVIIENAQDERAWAWLRREFPDATLLDALSRLGSRRAFISNIAVLLDCKCRMNEYLSRPSREKMAEFRKAYRSAFRNMDDAAPVLASPEENRQKAAQIVDFRAVALEEFYRCNPSLRPRKTALTLDP